MTDLPDAAATSRHGATIMRAGVSGWATCTCGWRSPVVQVKRVAAAVGVSVAWAEHVRDAESRRHRKGRGQ